MNREPTLGGIHHITAITSDARECVRFYEQVLGLRLVKQTVNFDDPYTYHLYFADSQGSPGTILTFFPWPGVARGTPGDGTVVATAFAVPEGSLEFWQDRLRQQGLATSRQSRFGEQLLTFSDPQGMQLELVAGKVQPATGGGQRQHIPRDHQIVGFHSATALLSAHHHTALLLTSQLGFTLIGQEDRRFRYGVNSDHGLGQYYDLLLDPQAVVGRQGSGSVHHIAFRTADDLAQQQWQQQLRQAGVEVTQVRDRNYFKSIYFHEPGGVLFEIATDPPGFTVDEELAELGQRLQLPPQYEPLRSAISERLPTLRGAAFKYAQLAAETESDDGVTLIALHGTGGDEHDLLPLCRQIAPGTAVISPRGKVVENGMNRFFPRLGPNRFADEEVRQNGRELAEFLRQCASDHDRSPSQLVALGYSNGANIAAALLLTESEVLAGAILLRPMLPLTLQTNLPNLHGKEILVLRGAEDRVIPSESTDQLIAALREAHGAVEVVTIDAGHELTAGDVTEAARWLAKRRKSFGAELSAIAG